MLLKIRPLDTVFFRDGKPFTMGAETWADGIFPPPPSVFYGALRTLWLSEQKDGISPANIEASAKLIISAVYVQIAGNCCFPAPIDVLENKERSQKVSLVEKELVAISNHASTSVLSTADDIEVEAPEPGALIKSADLETYFKGGDLSKIGFKQDYFCTESKVGIGLSKETRTSEEGMLYRVGMRRFSDEKTTFIVETSGLDLPQKGILRLGGEAKLAEFEQVGANTYSLPKTPPLEKGLNIYFSTPAVFENGWLPSWVDPQTLKGKWEGLSFQLSTAAVGRSVPMGGFDMKGRRPKRMFRAVPAGSVYRFKVLEGKVETLAQRCNISDFDLDKQGFGSAFLF
ncbi:MAG: hypothetical protein EPGJADBJ_05131 [Saprospiraceae bacterium]|nr:hypothetical protein [Saprospiraceae bacterium]